MIRVAFALLLALVARGTGAADDPPTVPTGGGLPVAVRVAVQFVDVASIDDVSGAFDATVDVRATWLDARLAYPPADAPNGFVEYRGDAALAKLAGVWVPDTTLANLRGDAEREAHGLRVFPDGRVERMHRVTGTFAAPIDVSRFPFDRQGLPVELASQRDPATRVAFDFRQRDVDFSRVARGVAVGGWRLGAVELSRDPVVGWYGARHARVRATLAASREPATTVAPIFIPLFASMLIPMLALWLNATTDDGEFTVEAFELTNVLIGGLFALIALNFTVIQAWPTLAQDNPVAWLFGLNYLLLGASLVINIAVFRYRLPARWFGASVQVELHRWLVWALPAVALVAAAAILMTARV